MKRGLSAALVVWAIMALTLHAALGAERIEFVSGDFTLVGELQLPEGDGPFPAIVMIHGSGESDRTDWGKYIPIMNRMLDAGYAVLCWDKPGVRESRGILAADGNVINQRAAILVAGIDHLKLHPSIDPARIGVWGLSQGGVVAPMALTMTGDITFLIVNSGPGTDGIAQGAYLQSRRLICRGSDEELAKRAEVSLSALPRSATYAEYLSHMQVLIDIPGLGYEESSIEAEIEWAPWDLSEGATFDPVSVIEQTAIPVLAFYGEFDHRVDPIQGVDAYQAALQGGHSLSQAILLETAGHTLNYTRSGCSDVSGRTYVAKYLDHTEGWLREILTALAAVSAP